MKKRLLLNSVVLLAWTALAGPDADTLPDNLIFRLSIANVSNLCAVLRESPIGRCWNAPAMQDFLGHPDLIRLLPAPQAPASALDEIRHLQKEQLKLLSGTFLLGLQTNAEEQIDIYLAAGMSPEQYAQLRELDQRIAKLMPESTICQRENFQKFEVWRTTTTADGRTNISWQTFCNGVLLESSDRAWIEKTLAQSKTAASRKPQGQLPLFSAELNGRWLTEMLAKGLSPTRTNAAATNTPPFRGEDVVRALKLSALESIALTLTQVDNQLQTAVQIHNQRAKNGIWALLDFTPLPADMRFPYVPSQIASFSVNRLDLRAFWNELPSILQGINPAMAALQQSFQATLQQMTGIDLSNDILQHLDNCYASCSMLDKDTSRTLLYWQLKNAAEARNTLQRLFAETSPLRGQFGENLRIDEFRGTQIYTIAPSTNNAPARAWSMAVSQTTLIAGDDEMVRAAVRAGDTPAGADFYHSAVYRQLQRVLPSDAAAWGFFDFPAFLRFYLNSENRAWQRQCEKLRERRGAASANWPIPDFSRMPSADQIAAFFGPLFSYTRATKDGFESVTIWSAPNATP